MPRVAKWSPKIVRIRTVEQSDTRTTFLSNLLSSAVALKTVLRPLHYMLPNPS